MIDYNLNFSPTGNAGDRDSGDVARAYADAIIGGARSRTDRSGSIMNMFNYYIEPVFCYNVNTDATTYNETAQVYVNLKDGYAAGSSQLLVVALYDETLRIIFDSEKVVETQLIS